MTQVDEISEIERLRSTLNITNALLEAVSSIDPVQALTARLSTLCHGSATVYDAEGKIIASSGEAPAQLIWNATSSTHRSELEFEVGRWTVRSRRVSLREGVHTIAIATRGGDTLTRLGDLLLDTAERLLGAVHGIRYGASRRDRRENEQLLAALHDGVLPSREHRFWNRLAQFRFPAYESIRAVELAPLDGGEAGEAHLNHLIVRARAEGLPLLAMLHRKDMDTPATVAAVLQGHSVGEQWLTVMSSQFLVGASSPFSALTQVAEAVREAETALRIARQRAATATTQESVEAVLMDRIDLTTWVLSHVDPRQLEERVARTLAPLDSVQLSETLITYLAADQSVTRTADALYVHPNTIRYRLSRVEEALGHSTNEAAMLCNVVLALHPQLISKHAELQRTLGEGEGSLRAP